MGLLRWWRRRDLKIWLNEHAETPCRSSHGDDCCSCENPINDPHVHVSIRRDRSPYVGWAGIAHGSCVEDFIDWASRERRSDALCPQEQRRDEERTRV